MLCEGYALRIDWRNVCVEPHSMSSHHIYLQVHSREAVERPDAGEDLPPADFALLQHFLEVEHAARKVVVQP